MTKTIKKQALVGLVLASIRSVDSLQAMETPDNKECHPIFNPAFNCLPLILAPATVENYKVCGYVTNLQLVCSTWNNHITQNLEDILAEMTIEITEDQMMDATGNVVENLKNNPYVRKLTFNFGGYIQKQWNDAWYNNHNNLILVGLENKPNLKYFKIKGDCIVSNFLNTSDYIGGKNPNEFLNLPHLKFLKTLEEFHITGYISGSSRQDGYFRALLICQETTPKLKKITEKCEFDGIAIELDKTNKPFNDL